MPFDRARGQEQLGAYLRIGQPVASQPSDGGLLRSKCARGPNGAPVHRLAGGPQLAPGAAGERLHADGVKHVQGDTQLRAASAAPVPAEPLAVEQVSTGQIRPVTGAGEPLDSVAVEALGGVAVAEQCTRAGLIPSPKSVPPACVDSASRAIGPAARPRFRCAQRLRSARARPTVRRT